MWFGLDCMVQLLPTYPYRHFNTLLMDAFNSLSIHMEKTKHENTKIRKINQIKLQGLNNSTTTNSQIQHKKDVITYVSVL